MRYIHYAIMLLLMAAAVEISCALAYWSGLVLRDEIFRSGNFYCIECNSGNGITYTADLGWDQVHAVRPTPAKTGRICGATYGDSFTYGREVEDADAWPFRLSSLLQCTVENYGVGGYGQDQTYLKYLKYGSRGEFVILGIFNEMLRRNEAASWTYYSSLPNALLKPYFRIEHGSLALERIPDNLDPASLIRHHRYDRFSLPYAIRFPYSFSFVRVLYFRLYGDALARNQILYPYSAWELPEPAGLSKLILTEFINSVQSTGKKVIVLLLPLPEWLKGQYRPYADYARWVADSFPDTCIIDPFAKLSQKHSAGISLRAPEGHYNKTGNEIIAEAVFEALAGPCSEPASRTTAQNG